MQRWLVLDTSTPVAVVGAVDVAADGSVVVVAEVALEKAQRHAEALPAVVADVRARVSGGDVVGVGVGVGPGSFIGVRTGIAFAKGLARALNVPLVGVSTLAALVASEDVDGAVTAVVDARRGELYVQAFNGLDAVGDARAVSVGGFDGGGVVVGPALVQPAHVRSGPSVRGLGRVLASRPRVDERVSLVPVYVRPPDAKLPALDPQRGLAALDGVLGTGVLEGS